jgi:hypothetical protein
MLMDQICSLLWMNQLIISLVHLIMCGVGQVIIMNVHSNINIGALDGDFLMYMLIHLICI